MPTVGQSSGPPVKVPLGMEACEGRVDFRTKLDFSLGLTYEFDYSQWVNQKTIASIQSFYINNSGNAFPLTITMGSSGQVIKIPAGAQAYLPVLQPNAPAWKISCTNGTSIAFLHALNFFLPPYMWGQTLEVDIPALTAIIISGRLNVRTTPQGVIETNASGTIAVGGTGQILFAANAARLQWGLQNPSTATEILQFSKVSIAGPWYDLVPGAFAGEDGSTVDENAMYVIAATTGHAFTADYGQ